MLPTPDTSHVSYDRVYEPAEDSFLLLDVLSSPSEKAFLSSRFHSRRTGHLDSGNSILRQTQPPLVLEVGSGSGVIIAFLTANAEAIFGRPDVLTLAVDVNGYACQATAQTVAQAEKATEYGTAHSPSGHVPAEWLDSIQGDLSGPVKAGTVDVLIFNPPYVPTSELPAIGITSTTKVTTFDQDSHLLSLSYAGGKDGMEVTDRLIEQLRTVLQRPLGVAYVLLCAQNQPEEVRTHILQWEGDWDARFVGSSGKQGGWERLQVLRIWQDANSRRLARPATLHQY